MNKKAKRITVGLVAVLCFLLVFALGFGITGAWYEARRTATGTVNLDQGIKIAYSGFANNEDLTEWDKDVELTLFETTSGVPKAEIAVPAARIAKVDNAKVIDFYVRAKVTYQYKLYATADRTVEDTLYTATELGVADTAIVATGLTFDAAWKAGAEGYYYYTDGSALKALPTTATAIFDGNDMVLADWTSEFGGPLVTVDEAEREVATIVVTLTLEAIQPEGATAEGWTL